MTGGKSVEVCLKFSPEVSCWISEQVWHSGQVITTNQDGSICLRFPVANFKEFRREILKYGASVEVLSPKALRKEIHSEIDRMSKNYSGSL